MKKLTKRLLVGSGILTLIGGLTACGGHHWHQHGEDMEGKAAHMVERVSAKLELDEAQRSKLDTLSQQLTGVAQDMRDQRMQGRSELLALFEQATFDREQAQAMAETRLVAMQEKAPAIITAVGDFYDSLNPEQQTQVRELMEKRMERGGRHWGH